MKIPATFVRSMILLVAMLFAACGDDSDGGAADTTVTETNDVSDTDDVANTSATDTGEQTNPGCRSIPIAVAQGDRVPVRTRLDVPPALATGEADDGLAFAWEIDGPPGGCHVFLPNASMADPIVSLHQHGVDTLRLFAADGVDPKACQPTETTVTTYAEATLHIELMWETPSDTDKCNDGPRAGSDLDIHFAHPSAMTDYDGNGDGVGEPWFDRPRDAYDRNSTPN
jgi:hypothetical protein